MATINVLNNQSAPFTVSSGDLTVTAGNTILTAGDVTVGNVAVGTTAPFVYFKKSRAGADITSGDLLGEVNFQGYAPTSGYVVGSRITSTSSGTIANNRVASDLKFYTHPDSTTAATLRTTIASTGQVSIANMDGGTATTDYGAYKDGCPLVVDNLIVASESGKFTYVGLGAGRYKACSSTYSAGNTGIGYYALSHDAGVYDLYRYNTAVGAYAGWQVSGESGSESFGNTLIGWGSGYTLPTRNEQNTAVGYKSLYAAGQYSKCNVIIGSQAAVGMTRGAYNIILGYNSASAITSSQSDSNIIIGNASVNGEDNKIRIGTQGTGDGQQDACYIAGIYNTAVGATAGVVLSDSAHQLGGLAGSANTVFVGGAKPSFTATPRVTSITFDGTNNLGNYSTTTWTPDLQFGGAKTGITYSTQTGTYYRIGNVIYYRCIIVLTSKGSDTGAATIEGLPVTVASTTVGNALLGVATYSGVQTACKATASSTSLALYFVDAAGGAVTAFADSHMANTTTIDCSGFYFV